MLTSPTGHPSQESAMSAHHHAYSPATGHCGICCPVYVTLDASDCTCAPVDAVRSPRQSVRGSDGKRPTMRCAYDTTRTSPFGYYGLCRCGWVTPAYSPTAREAWQAVAAHVTLSGAAMQDAAYAVEQSDFA